MLPDRLLDIRKRDDLTRVPAWLSSKDEVWIAPLCEEMEAFAGRQVAEVDARVKELADLMAQRFGASRRAIEGIWVVERHRWTKSVASPIPPPTIRKVLFELAAVQDHAAALAEAARLLELEPDALRRALFADRRAERVLGAPKQRRSPSEIVEQYNLALAQSLLCRSLRIVALVRTNARHVLSYAKLLGLMATFVEQPEENGVELTLSGPLALFRDTMKYGHLVARFVPALASTPGWSALADVRLFGEEHELLLSHLDPLPRAHALPVATDSVVEKRLATDLRKIGPARGWELERESSVVRVGQSLFYPDFALVSARGKVLVEVVGFWTPEYLQKKRQALAAVTQPMVVCVALKQADALGVSGPNVVTYRDRIDAEELIRAAERALVAW